MRIGFQLRNQSKKQLNSRKRTKVGFFYCIDSIFDQSGVGDLVISFLGPAPNQFLERKVEYLFEFCSNCACPDNFIRR